EAHQFRFSERICRVEVPGRGYISGGLNLCPHSRLEIQSVKVIREDRGLFRYRATAENVERVAEDGRACTDKRLWFPSRCALHRGDHLREVVRHVWGGWK